MTKHLLIQYGDLTLFSAPVGRITFTESDSGTVEIKAGPERGNSTAVTMLEQLTKRAKETPHKPLTNSEPTEAITHD